MQKIIFADVDDISLDWIGDFNTAMGWEASYTPQVWGYPEMPITYEDVKTFIQRGPMNSPIQNSIDYLNKIQNQGWKVILITSHPTNMMMERIKNLKEVGLKYDHIVFTQSFNDKGETVSFSKAQYIQEVYGHIKGYKILLDDRMKSVNEFVNLGLGFGVSMDRAYNSKELAELQESVLLKKRIILGRHETRLGQVADALVRMDGLIKSLECPVVANSYQNNKRSP